MKYFFICLFFSSLAYAENAPTTPTKGHLIKTTIRFQDPDSKRQIKIQSEFINAEDHHLWMTLSKSKKGIIVLGRVAEHDEKSILMQYLLIDSKKPAFKGVIASPSIKTQFGETGSISQGAVAEKPNIEISFNATKTDYTSKE